MKKTCTAATTQRSDGHNRQGRTPLVVPRFKVREILVPTDFSAAARRALKYARPLARRCEARLTLLHVVAPEKYEADYGYGPVMRQCANKEQVIAAAKRLQSIGRPANECPRGAARVVRCGEAAEEIIRAARELRSDLIVLAESSATLSALKSVAERIVGGAPCPVLVVRKDGVEFKKPTKDR
jgi:nucleotide-binding universal stress UspA family protein